MKKEELKRLMESLQLEFEAKPQLMYVFYEREDGTVNNFSISIRRGQGRKKMSRDEMVSVMEGYPDARGQRIVAVEHPDEGPKEWLDTQDVCQMLHTTRASLQRWREQGWLAAHRVGRRVYYDRADIDALLESGRLQENGRLDRTAGPET